jgi:glycosyltransferase involved in cell wall biosynthesis
VSSIVARLRVNYLPSFGHSAVGIAMPTVSVILPTFNRTRYLKLAIESVFAQTYTDWEMIIADDGSTEETKAYLQSIGAPQVRPIWLRHCGNPSRVRNAAIDAASGRYLAFLDSDDIWAPSKLEKQVGALRDRATCRWSYTNCDRIDENGRPLANEPLRTTVPQEGWIFEPLLRLEVAISMPTVVADRDLVGEIGGFDEQQPFAEWHDLCLRLATKSQVVALNESLCSVRAHTEHYSADRIAAHISWMRLYEKMADLTPSPTLRSYCARMRTETSMNLARIQGDKGNYGAVLTTLRKSLLFSWRFPQWWWGALKRIARPAVPKILISALRRQRGRG